MSTVTIETRGAVRHVILDRPAKRNALDAALIAALAEALRAAADDHQVRCVVLRGAGAVFSAGMDLAELAALAEAPERLREYRREILATWNLAEEMPKPTIAQLHGACIGGALELALACDLRVMAEDAVAGLPETRVGLIPDLGGCSRLPAVVGLGRAKEMIMTGRMVGAEEALRSGLANRVAPAERLDEATAALADELLACSPLAVGLAKRALDAAAKPALSTTLELELTAQQVCVGSLRPEEDANRPAQT